MEQYTMDRVKYLYGQKLETSQHFKIYMPPGMGYYTAFKFGALYFSRTRINANTEFCPSRQPFVDDRYERGRFVGAKVDQA